MQMKVLTPLSQTAADLQQGGYSSRARVRRDTSQKRRCVAASGPAHCASSTLARDGWSRRRARGGGGGGRRGVGGGRGGRRRGRRRLGWWREAIEL